MLRQEINLNKFLISTEQRKSTLTWSRVWLLNLLFGLLLIIIYFFSLWDLRQLRIKNQSMVAQIAILQKNFFELKKQFPELFFTQDATHSVNRLAQQIEAQSRLLTSIANPIPFSVLLISFAKNITPDTWLSYIAITQGGTEILLKGQTNNLANFHNFLDTLSHDKLFADYLLNTNALNTKTTSGISFEVNLVKQSK